jgi:hypothetical protein
LARWAADPGGNVVLPVAVGTSDLADGSWHFVVGVRDTLEKQLKVYVDGMLEATVADSYATSVLDPEVDLWIGGQNGWSARYFNGDIDDVGIYNRALSAAEILELYQTPDESGEEWLSVDPKSGTVPPGGSVSVAVSFNAAGFSAGDSTNAVLLVRGNDVFAPSNAVPVSMTVIANEEADRDGDLIPDYWEEKYFGSATGAEPDADSDGDGQSNLDEYIAGMDPTDPDSAFVVRTFDSPTNGAFVLSWDSVTGRVYSVYWQTNLPDAFQTLETGIRHPQDSYTDSVHNAENQGFYWIDVEME